MKKVYNLNVTHFFSTFCDYNTFVFVFKLFANKLINIYLSIKLKNKVCNYTAFLFVYITFKVSLHKS